MQNWFDRESDSNVDLRKSMVKRYLAKQALFRWGSEGQMGDIRELQFIEETRYMES